MWETIVKVVVPCVNFIRVNGLKHRQFQEFLSEQECDYIDVLYHMDQDSLNICPPFTEIDYDQNGA